jgi:hypothetical protein
MNFISRLKIYVILIVILLQTSCSGLLEKEPYDLVPEGYFNTQEELESFLTGTYSLIMQTQFYGNYYILYNAGGDDLGFYQRSNAATSIICANTSSSDVYITSFWRILYEGVNRANILIENVNKNEEIKEEIRKRVLAEALFLRSFYYFNLVQGWGDVPLRLSSTQTVTGLDIARTDREIIYEQIISDIIKAIPDLKRSDELPHTGTITQSGAKGMLARIYLFRAGEHYRQKLPAPETKLTCFEEAKRWALEVKESNLHGLVTPYSQVFIDLSKDKYNSTGVRESIWEAEMAGNNSIVMASGRVGNIVGFGAKDFSATAEFKELGGMANPGLSYKLIYATLKLYDMYENEQDTARSQWNIAPFEYLHADAAPYKVLGRRYYEGKRPAELTTVEGLPCTDETRAYINNRHTRCAAKYRREYETVIPKDKNWTPINFPIMRYSDILLMIAEADNELTGTPSDVAYDCIDEVRNRAGISPLKGTGLSKDEFREAIKRERAMELCFETTRRWDLIRWGEFVKNMTETLDDINKAEWSPDHKYAANYFKLTDAYNYYPIPIMELSVNKLITQNPGW